MRLILFLFLSFFSLADASTDPQYIFSPPTSNLEDAVLRSTGGEALSLYNQNSRLYFNTTDNAGSKFLQPRKLTSSRTSVYNAREGASNNIFSFYCLDNNIYYSYGTLADAFKTINTYTLDFGGINVIYSSLVEYVSGQDLFILILDTDKGLTYVEFHPTGIPFQNIKIVPGSTDVEYRQLAVNSAGDLCLVWLTQIEDVGGGGLNYTNELHYSFKPFGSEFSTYEISPTSGSVLTSVFDVNFVGINTTTYFMITYVENNSSSTGKGFLVQSNGSASSTRDMDKYGDTYVIGASTLDAKGMIVDGQDAYLFNPALLETQNITESDFTTKNIGSNITPTYTLIVGGAAYVSYQSFNDNTLSYSYLPSYAGEFIQIATYKYPEITLLAQQSPGEAFVLWSGGNNVYTSYFNFSNIPAPGYLFGISKYMPVFYKNSFYP